jgi:hypothetical protein
MKKLIILLAIVSIAFLVTPQSGQACQCDLADVLTEYEWADAVFTATVVSIVPASDPDYFQVLVLVTGVWKGISTPVMHVYTNATDGACRYVFNEGVEYIIYAAQSLNPCCQGVWTSMCNRTMPLYAAQADLDLLGPPGTVPTEKTTWGGVKAQFE